MTERRLNVWTEEGRKKSDAASALLSRAFAVAVRPLVEAEEKEADRLYQQKGLVEKIWGMIKVIEVVAFYRALDLLEGKGWQKAAGGDPIEERTVHLAEELSGFWLRQIRDTNKNAGTVCESTILPGDPACEEGWEKVRQMMKNHYGIENLDAVLRTGLAELAKTPGDIELPVGMQPGMKIERATLQAALAHAPAP